MALFLILFITAPVLAQSIYHTATYDMDGVMDFKKQAGHFCNTGAEIKQVISGSGKMDKTQTVTMVKGKITMDDKNDWVAGATPLTVTTVWKLCTPPKYTYDGVSEVLLALGSETGAITAPVGLASLYNSARSIPAVFEDDGALGFNGWASGVTVEALASLYGWDALTEQYWAVQVQANPGSAGNLQQNGEAAYGPYGNLYDKDVRRGGKYFVGDFFNISQHSRVNDGTIKRYIDISSPVSHGYLHEDMSVIGKASIREAFRLTNYSAGSGVSGKWYNLF